MMNRSDFHKAFKTTGPAVTPVIHVVDQDQVARNIEIAIGEGAQGVFLINHDFGVEPFLPIIRTTREKFPYLWLGLNFLAVTGKDAFPVLGKLSQEDCPIDAYWADDARIDEREPFDDQEEAKSITEAREQSGWSGLYFGGTAFKKQRDVAPEDYGRSAEIAREHMDVVTTSGVATGHEAETSKISTFRTAMGDHPLALASGVTPDNAKIYRDVDCFLVATGINIEGDFYNIDQQRLRRLLTVTREMGGGRTDG
ncbi:MAG: adenine phosphoribosyltransferase [Cyanobacteria bacterium P01_F01_bin.33]